MPVATRLSAALSLPMFLVLCAAGCLFGGDSNDDGCSAPTLLPPPFNAAALPESVQIGARTYTLLPYIWRDFMPISPPGGKPMVASIGLLETDSLDIAPGLRMDSLWVMRDTIAWAAALRNEEGPAASPFLLKRIARCGPKWEPHIAVDVVVKLVDGDLQEYLLSSADVEILRTD